MLGGDFRHPKVVKLKQRWKPILSNTHLGIVAASSRCHLPTPPPLRTILALPPDRIDGLDLVPRAAAPSPSRAHLVSSSVGALF
uniref:Uncharacterized protein n=1 Tax=Fagus sylvatica TaxID=28930 RepID=A0A2N9IM88_FAGSY